MQGSFTIVEGIVNSAFLPGQNSKHGTVGRIRYIAMTNVFSMTTTNSRRPPLVMKHILPTSTNRAP